MQSKIMNNKSKIKNIIFDLGEVLIHGIKNTGRVLKEKHKISDALFKTPLLVPIVEELFLGNVSEDAYIKAVLKEYPELGTQEYLKAHIRENFREVEGTREIVIKLRKLGYKTAILSIHGKEWIDYLEKKFNFHYLFDALSYSYEDKVSKPHPSAFLKVLQKLDAKPEECIFIDDHEKNIEAAKILGIESILFTTAEDLHNNLKQILPDF